MLATRRFRPLAAVVILVVLAAGPIMAADDPPAVTWEQVVKLADAHPGMGKTQALVGAAKVGVGLARQVPNPDVTLDMGYGESNENGDAALVWGLELGIPLDWIGEKKPEVKQAKSKLQAAAYEAQATQSEILGGLRTLYVMIGFDQASRRALEEMQGQVGQLAETARLRVDKGEAAPDELTRVEVEFEKTGLAVAGAESQAALHRQILDLALGGKLPDDFTVEFDLENLPELPPLDKLLAEVPAGHPAVKAQAEKIKAAQAAVGVEKGKLFPGVAVGAFYEQEVDVKDAGAFLGLTLPLWNWNKGGIAAAKAEVAAAGFDKELAILDLKSSILKAHAAAGQARASALTYRDSILPKMEEATASLEKKYKTGDSDLSSVLDARRKLIEVEIEYLRILFDFHAAIVELETLSGGNTSW